MSFELTWLPEVLLQAGLKVAEVEGWRDRGRASMGPVKGVICHFTNGASRGNMPSLGVLVNGRSDLPGPLSQLGLGRDGTYYVVAAGRCNHAGVGKWQNFRNGNSSFIGIEAENTGRSEPWPDVQMTAYRHGVAAILRHINADESMCCGHKEWAPPKGRKDNPDFDMDAFRDPVRSILNGQTQAIPLIPNTDQSGRPTLRRGARGPLVARMQALLGLPSDGIFGPMTEATLRASNWAAASSRMGSSGRRRGRRSSVSAALPSRSAEPRMEPGKPARPIPATAPLPCKLHQRRVCQISILSSRSPKIPKSRVTSGRPGGSRLPSRNRLCSPGEHPT